MNDLIQDIKNLDTLVAMSRADKDFNLYNVVRPFMVKYHGAHHVQDLYLLLQEHAPCTTMLLACDAMLNAQLHGAK